jgi:hypothetical protein
MVARASPRTWRRSFSLMVKPAASSAARFILKPELSFSTDFSSLFDTPSI